MFTKWIKKLIPDDQTTKNYFFLRKFKIYVRYPYLWQLKRENVARGVAVGLFVALIPIIPFQTVLVILLSILLRANIPVAFLASWVSNPFTIIPLIFLTYYIGDLILDEYGHENSLQEYKWQTIHAKNFHDYVTYFKTGFSQFGKAFFVGLPLLAIGAGIVGYLLVHVIWRWVDQSKQHSKK